MKDTGRTGCDGHLLARACIGRALMLFRHACVLGTVAAAASCKSLTAFEPGDVGVEQRVEVESDASPQWFILRVSDGMSGAYQVDVRGIDGGGFFGFDPMTYLYSSRNNSLELMDRDDDSGSGFDSRLDDVVLSEGSYYIAVIEVTGSSGSFSIGIDRVE